MGGSVDPDRYLERAEELKLDIDDLTEWEQNFIVSVLEILKAGRALSPKQAHKLVDLHDDWLNIRREFLYGR
jgi:hypothetical protein